MITTTIVTADDHPMMLHGINDFLTSKGFKVTASAQDGKTAYNLIVKHKPDIAILDVRMPNLSGLEVAAACKKNNLETKIILFTFDKDAMIYNSALELNIHGYLLKEFAIEEIEECITTVTQGKTYISKTIDQFLEQHDDKTPPEIKNLTKTEIKILKFLAHQKSNFEIAEDLSISIRTVEKHRSNIVAKLQLQKTYNSLLIWVNEHNELLKTL